MKIVLVYQSGIANVFEVDAFTLQDHHRYAERLLQADFRTCASFARGCGAAGATVRTASCNVAGDCAKVEWYMGTDGTPFRDEAAIVTVN